MVHYQSRAQVPAPCVGKPGGRPCCRCQLHKRPGGGPLWKGQRRGVQSPLPLAPFRSFSAAARAASLGCRPRS